MKALIFADKPTKEEANEHLYRSGMLWARGYKPAIPVAGVSMLEREVTSLTEAGFELTIVGDPTEPRKLLGESVEYINPGHSLGDKFRALVEYGDEMILVGGCDVCPSQEDARGLYELIQEHKDASFIAPMVRGQALVDIGFRDDIRTKIYRLRDDYARSERLAFPQFYAGRPGHFHLEIAARVADKYYKNRENGCNQSWWSLIKAYSLEKHSDDSPGLWRSVAALGLFSAATWSSKRKLHDHPIANFHQARTIVGGLVARVPISQIAIVPNDYKTIACDIDTEEELAIVEQMMQQENW